MSSTASDCRINESRPFRLSSVLTAFFPKSVEKLDILLEGIALSAEMGFDSVEFFYDGPETGQIREALSRYMLSSIFLASYGMKSRGLDPGHPDLEERCRVLDSMKGWLDQSRNCGSSHVMIVSGPDSRDPGERSSRMERSRETIKALCEYGTREPTPVRISLEAFNDSGEPWFLLGPTSRSVEMAESLGPACSNFSLTLDLSHLLQLRENPEESIREAADHCTHIHLANCVIADPDHPLFGDKHPAFGVEQGEVDEAILSDFLSSIISTESLLNRPYPLTLGLEVIARDPDNPRAVMAEAKRTFDKAWRACLHKEE